MNEQQKIQIPKKRKYWTQVPNLYIDADLTVYEFRLLIHYIRVGDCYQSTRTTAKKCHMSLASVVKCRQSLKGNGWIELSESDKGTIQVNILDKWKENMARYGGTSEATPQRSPDERAALDVPLANATVRLAVSSRSPGSTEEEPIKKILLIRDKDSGDKKSRPRDLLFDEICKVCRVDPKTTGASIGKVKQVLLKAGYTADDVRAFGEWWNSDTWRRGNGPPSIWKLKEQIGTVRMPPEESDSVAPYFPEEVIVQ